MSTNQPRFTILAIDSLHMFVRDLAPSREHFIERLGFRQAGLSGAELQAEQALRASMLESGEARVVFMTPLSERAELAAFLAARGPGIGRVVLEVDDAEAAHEQLVRRGAQLKALPQAQKVELGCARWFDVSTPFEGTVLRFVQYQDCRKVMPGLICRAPRKTSHGALGVGGLCRIGLRCADRQLGVRYACEVLGFSLVDPELGLLREPSSGVELSLSPSAAPESLTLRVAQLDESATLMLAAGASVQRSGGQLRVDCNLSPGALPIYLREVEAARAERAA